MRPPRAGEAQNPLAPPAVISLNERGRATAAGERFSGARPLETKLLVQALHHFGSPPSSNEFDFLRPRDGCVINFEKCVFGRKVPRLQFLVDVLNSKWMRVKRVGAQFRCGRTRAA
jgi:hypothetical protein